MLAALPQLFQQKLAQARPHKSLNLNGSYDWTRSTPGIMVAFLARI